MNQSSNSIHICLQIHTLPVGLQGLFSLPLLSMWFLLCLDYMLGWEWDWAPPGLTQEHKQGGLAVGQGPYTALEILLVCSSERIIPEDWEGRKWIFLFFHWSLLFSHNFPTTFTNTCRLAFAEGEGLSPSPKGKHFVLHAACTMKWMFWIAKLDQM